MSFIKLPQGKGKSNFPAYKVVWGNGQFWSTYDAAYKAHSFAARKAKELGRLDKVQLFENVGQGEMILLATYEGYEMPSTQGPRLLTQMKQRFNDVAQGATQEQRWADAKGRTSVKCVYRHNK